MKHYSSTAERGGPVRHPPRRREMFIANERPHSCTITSATAVRPAAERVFAGINAKRLRDAFAAGRLGIVPAGVVLDELKLIRSITIPRVVAHVHKR